MQSVTKRQMVTTNFSFVFVCHRGRLEIEALLLAASLRKNMRCEYEMVVAVPEPHELLPPPSDQTVQQLESLGARFISIRNELLSRARDHWYLKMANKVYCFRLETTYDKIVFLDSDHLVCGQYDPSDDWCGPLALRAQDASTAVCLLESWDDIYSSLNLPTPTQRVRVTGDWDGRYYDVHTPPAFNSSLVAIDRALAVEFSQVWEDCIARLESAEAVVNVYHTEQGAMAAAVHQLGIPYEMMPLDESCRHMRHYVNPTVLQGDPQASVLASELVAELQLPTSLFERLPDEWQWLRPR